MQLPCKFEAKEKRREFFLKCNFNRGYHPLRPLKKPIISFSFKSDFYFESRFELPSLNSTILDDGVRTVFLAPPPSGIPELFN